MAEQEPRRGARNCAAPRNHRPVTEKSTSVSPKFTVPSVILRSLKVASIPFRFKAGGGASSMPGIVEQHHHRSTTKTSHKPYKSRFASKNALKDASKGKIERGIRRTPHQTVMSKFDRRNKAKQHRINKSREHAQTTTVFQGRDGASRHVTVIPLCEDIDTAAVVRSLNKSLDIPDDIVPTQGKVKVSIERFKQKITFNTVRRELWAALSACQVADYVLFVLSPDKEVDQLGELLLRSIESQGITTVYTAVQGLDHIEPVKRRPQVQNSLKSFITHFFPDQEKVFSLDNRQECQNVVRSLCTTTPKGIRWREERSWMSVEEVRWPEGVPQDQSAMVQVTGIVRGKSLKADRLISVGDWGEFQIDKIDAAPLEQSKKGKGNAMTVDNEGLGAILEQPGEDQDTLAELAPEEAVMQDVGTIAPSMATTERRGVLLDDQHYFSDEDGEEESEDVVGKRRLPRGTSKYQAAWYLGDVSDSGSDLEDFDEEDEDIGMDDVVAGPADGIEGIIPAVDPTEIGQSEYPQSEMFDDRPIEDEAEELAAYRERKQKDADEDLRFPDEIELHPNVSARERLAKYRGLKSLRTSPWDAEEDRPHQPSEWDRLLDINDYKGARSRVLKDTLIGGVKPGTRVTIHIRNVPMALASTYDPSAPLPLFSLLQHEHKHTALNFSLSLSSEITEPLKAKEELIIQYGPRRFAINPIFSQAGNTPNDVHKFERYLHPGRSAVASFVGPLMWGSVPALFFRKTQAKPDAEAKDTCMDTSEEGAPSLISSLELVGHGSAMAPSTSRIIAKRAVLTGEPYKVHRKVVTVRYMFFNAEDIAWFKALPLWTNRGRQGTIKESLGTHGYFKATFDAKINMQDAIGISLYKRMWPRPARTLGVDEL